MNRNEIIEKLARSILETTQEPDHIEGNVDREMEELGDDVLSKCRELTHEYFDVHTPDGKVDWIVPLTKDYVKKSGHGSVTVEGKMRVSATSAEAAHAAVAAKFFVEAPARVAQQVLP